MLAFAISVPSVGATQVQPGWTMEVPSDTVFVGDPVNITVHGSGVNVTVEIRLTDANGTLHPSFYAYLDEGTAYYNYTGSVEDPPGVWRVEARVNDFEVAYAEFRMVFDELNYLSKRVSLQEAHDKQQAGMTQNLIEDNQRLHATIDIMMVIIPSMIISFLAYFLFLLHPVTWALFRFSKFLEKEFGPFPEDSAWARLQLWLVGYYSSSELAQFSDVRRLRRPRRWPAAAIAQRARGEMTALGAVKAGLRPVAVPKDRSLNDRGSS